MNKETLVKAVALFQEQNKRWYHRDYPNDLTIKKVFNHRMGLLDLFCFDLQSKVVAINATLATASDRRKLSEFLRDNHMENWHRVEICLGYPDWYFHSLSYLAKKQIQFA